MQNAAADIASIDPCRYEIVCGARRHFAVAILRRADATFTQPFLSAIHPSDRAPVLAATAKILETLSTSGKGCPRTTISGIKTNIRLQARAA